MYFKIFITIIFACITLSTPIKAIAEIDFIKSIKDRGSLIVGLPPYNTPPFYYKDSDPEIQDSDAFMGNDIELMRDLAKNLGVNVVFDQSSKSFNDTVFRAGKGDFDIAIGKLSTNYLRMSNAHPHEYMNFRQALLANRKYLSNFSKISDNELGKAILESEIKVGFIGNSSYETAANSLMKNAKKVSYSSWNECIEGLKSGEVDAIYRDATEIKKIVYMDPNLSIKYVPILFNDVKDTISIYLSTAANTAMDELLTYYLKGEKIKKDKEIIEEYTDFYKPIISN